MNERIRVPEVLVIDDAGNKLGVMDTRRALEMARERGLDLVEVAPGVRPPVCKILDYGKLKYAEAKKQKEAKKKQVSVTVKEIQLRPRTEDHDLETKFRHIAEFLTRGDKVRVILMFRGREMAYTHQGYDMLRRLQESSKEFAVVEQRPKLEGRRMVMLLGPGKNAESWSKDPVLVPLSALAPLDAKEKEAAQLGPKEG